MSEKTSGLMDPDDGRSLWERLGDVIEREIDDDMKDPLGRDHEYWEQMGGVSIGDTEER